MVSFKFTENILYIYNFNFMHTRFIAFEMIWLDQSAYKTRYYDQWENRVPIEQCIWPTKNKAKDNLHSPIGRNIHTSSYWMQVVEWYIIFSMHEVVFSLHVSYRFLHLLPYIYHGQVDIFPHGYLSTWHDSTWFPRVK